MVRILAALGRSLPLLIALIVLAVALYFVISWRRTPARAKEILIKVFTVLCSAIAIFFALVSLYALAEGNTPVLELAASCAGIGVIGLIITLVCRFLFKKHHPHYQHEANAKARPLTTKPDLLNVVTKVLNYLNDHRKR